MNAVDLARDTKEYMIHLYEGRDDKPNGINPSLINLIEIYDELCEYFNTREDEINRLSEIMKSNFNYAMRYFKDYSMKIFKADFSFCIMMYLNLKK